MSTPFKKRRLHLMQIVSQDVITKGEILLLQFSRVSVEFLADYWLMSPGVSV